MPRNQIRVSHTQFLRVAEFVKEQYTQLALTDAQFAELAKGELGFPVSASTIGEARQHFSIPCTRDTIRAKSAAEGNWRPSAKYAAEMRDRLATLEERVARLETSRRDQK